MNNKLIVLTCAWLLFLKKNKFVSPLFNVSVSLISDVPKNRTPLLELSTRSTPPPVGTQSLYRFLQKQSFDVWDKGRLFGLVYFSFNFLGVFLDYFTFLIVVRNVVGSDEMIIIKKKEKESWWRKKIIKLKKFFKSDLRNSMCFLSDCWVVVIVIVVVHIYIYIYTYKYIYDIWIYIYLFIHSFISQ